MDSKYEEALKRAREWYNVPDASELDKELLSNIFPELKESEDERIRKAILELVKQSSEILEKKNQEQMIAWLEKQGNIQKKEEPVSEELEEEID